MFLSKYFTIIAVNGVNQFSTSVQNWVRQTEEPTTCLKAIKRYAHVCISLKTGYL